MHTFLRGQRDRISAIGDRRDRGHTFYLPPQRNQNSVQWYCPEKVDSDSV